MKRNNLLVIAIQVATVFTVCSPSPPVVDDDLLLDLRLVVEPGKKLLGLPVVVWALVGVGPDQVRLVLFNQFVQLWDGLRLRKIKQ